MTTPRLLVSAVAVLLALGGCGGAASTNHGGAGDKAPADTGTLTVGQTGTTPAKTVWYVRIETTGAEPLVEKGFPGKQISLSRHLEPGQYRVISWYRQCKDACPTSGTKGLGPLEQVCGAPVTISKGQRAKAMVTVGVEGCQVTVQ